MWHAKVRLLESDNDLCLHRHAVSHIFGPLMHLVRLMSISNVAMRDCFPTPYIMSRSLADIAYSIFKAPPCRAFPK